jgi:hypothetical protein
MIRVELTRDQKIEALRGFVSLTPEQVASANATRSAAMRISPGRKADGPPCLCGCGLSLARAMKRHPARALGG